MAGVTAVKRRKDVTKGQVAVGASSPRNPQGGPRGASLDDMKGEAHPPAVSASGGGLNKLKPKRKRGAAAADSAGCLSDHEQSAAAAADQKPLKRKRELPARKDDALLHAQSQHNAAAEEADDLAAEDDAPQEAHNLQELTPTPAAQSAAASAAGAATASASASGSWAAGRRWVVLLSFCPLLLLRRRSSSKKEQRKQQSSCLLTADDHSHLVVSGVTVGPAGGSSSTSSKKGLNPVMPVVRRVQAHLAAVSSAVCASQRDSSAKQGSQGTGAGGPVEGRMRECVATEAARLAAAAAAPEWVAAACMRADVVHQCLLSLLDSPLVKMLRQQQQQLQHEWRALDLLLHTLDGKLLRVSLDFRVPRTFKVFKKVIEMALSSPTGRLEPNTGDTDDSSQQQQQPLIEVLQPPFFKHFAEDARWIALSESRSAPSVSLRTFIEGLPSALTTAAVAAAGANSSGCGGNSKAAGRAGPSTSRQQERGRPKNRAAGTSPPVVFVISVVSSIDSAVVPQWQRDQEAPSKPNGTTEESSSSGSVSINGQVAEAGTKQRSALVAVAPYSYPMPASLRCDRLMHELTRAVTGKLRVSS
ncbi:hypothetical protein Efla_001398 [Eimeria flavescens]